jgi:hypothetical protein
VADEVVFQPGDTVAIVEHRRAPRLYPNCPYTVPASEGWMVTEVYRPLLGGFHEREMSLLKAGALGELDHKHEWVNPHYARLLVKGPGKYTKGVSLPYSQRELDNQEFHALVEKIHKALDERGTHEGWSNPATWAVALTLKNEKRVAREVYASIRKDGTRNVRNMHRTFWRGRAHDTVLEPWMFEPPIDIPGKFARWAMPTVKERLAVNWAEIELDLRDPSWQP